MKGSGGRRRGDVFGSVALYLLLPSHEGIVIAKGLQVVNRPQSHERLIMKLVCKIRAVAADSEWHKQLVRLSNTQSFLAKTDCSCHYCVPPGTFQTHMYMYMPLRRWKFLWVVVVCDESIDVVVAIPCVLRIHLSRSDTGRLEYSEHYMRWPSQSGRTIHVTTTSPLYEVIAHPDLLTHRPGDGV